MSAAVDLAVELDGAAAERVHGAIVARRNPELRQPMNLLAGDDPSPMRLPKELPGRLQEPSPTA